jgi:hypothetical protein
VVAWLADFAESWNCYEMEVERFIDAGDRVVSLVRIQAEGAASGVEVTRGDAIVWTLRFVMGWWFASTTSTLMRRGSTRSGCRTSALDARYECLS